VTLPISRPAIVAGVSLALMETLADYGAVSYFGVSTFTTGIFRTWYGLDSVTTAAQLALALLMFIIILIAIEKHSRRRIKYHTQKSNRSLGMDKLSLPKSVRLILLCCIPLLFGFVIPVWQLLVWAIQTHQQLWEPAFWNLLENTITLAVITSLLALILALSVAYSHRIVGNAITRISKRIAALGYAVPGVVIAVGILIPLASLDNTIDTWFRVNFELSTGLLISGTSAALIIAYLVRFLAISINAVDSGLQSINPSMDQAARSLGSKPITTLRKVHIPIIKGSLLSGLLIVFVEVMKELPATLILRPFNFNTLAVRAYELASDERLADAALPAIAIVLAGLIPVILLTKKVSN
jgi:iron(III) transport system permease protein